MTRRQITWILIIAAIALACVPHARRGGDGDAEASVPNAHVTAPSTPPDTSLAASAKVAVGSDVQFALQVTNLAPHSVEVNFPNGQTHEFVVLDSIGREVWRWSSGRMFTQALQNRDLDANQTLSFTEEWDPKGMHGKYVAVAELRSSNHPVTERIDFVLP